MCLTKILRVRLKLAFFFVTYWHFVVDTFLQPPRELCVQKGEAFQKKINEILDELESDTGLSKADFDNKKDYFNEHWKEIVTSTENCIDILDDDDNKEEAMNEVNYHIEVLKEPAASSVKSVILVSVSVKFNKEFYSVNFQSMRRS